MIKLATALVATIVGSVLAAPPSQAAEPLLSLYESFAGVPDGPAPTTLAGTDYPVTNYSPVASAAPYVRGGFLTTTDPATARGGAYRVAELAEDVSAVGAEFVFTPQTADGGVLCLSIQADNIATAGPGVPVSPVHLVVGPERWFLDVNTKAGTGVDGVFHGTFAEPLATDGTTIHRTELLLDRASSTVRLSLPDGSTRTLTHPAFGLGGRFVYVEPYKSAGYLERQTDALVSSWWANTQPVTVEPTDRPSPAPTPDPAPASPVVPPEPQPTVTPPAPETNPPGMPRRVRAERTGRRIIVTWRRAAEADVYRVRCGTQVTSVTGRRAVVRGKAIGCSVRAVSEVGSSSWVKVRVRA